jgi:hypothetical protein
LARHTLGVDVTWLKRLVISKHSSAINGNVDNEEKEENQTNENEDNFADNGNPGRIFVLIFS